jgi:hypothetical protein
MKIFKITVLLCLFTLITGCSANTQNNTKNVNDNPETSTNINSDSPKLLAQTVGKPTDCSQYSYEELTAVWGVPFIDIDIKDVVELTVDGGIQYGCNYNQTNDGTGVTYAIEYREFPSVDQAIQEIANVKSSAQFGDKVYFTIDPIPNLGDEAFYWTRSLAEGIKDMNQQMYVRKGSVVFMLSGVNIDGVNADYKDKLLKSFQLHFE